MASKKINHRANIFKTIKPGKIELEGATYIIDFSKLTDELVEELRELEKQMSCESPWEHARENIDAFYRSLEIYTGIEREKLEKLDIRIANTLMEFIKDEAQKAQKKADKYIHSKMH